MSIPIFILGSLAEQNNYAYSIYKGAAETLAIVQVSGLTESKLYYHFEALHKRGHVETVEVLKDPRRPEKTMYQITDAGRLELEKKIYTIFKQSTDVVELYSALIFIKHVEIDEVLSIFGANIEKQKMRWTPSLKDKVPQEVLNKNKHLPFIADHATSYIDFRIEWLERLFTYIKSLQS